MSRNTASKVAIKEILDKSEHALSQKEILASLDGMCDRVTVYRILDRLIDECSVHKIMDMDGVARYAACHDCGTVHNHNHVHFSCSKCNTVTCLDNVEPEVSLPEGYVAKEAVYTLSGLCPKCS